MLEQKWDAILMPGAEETRVWELLHENSKTSRFDRPPSDEAVTARMAGMYESLSYELYPSVELPGQLAPLRLSLAEAITGRVTARSMQPCTLSLPTLNALLYYAYGVTRDNRGTAFPRPFRTVPSGGALYPLEIFFHSAHVAGLPAGLYHYNPSANNLQCLHARDDTERLAQALVHGHVAHDAALLVFITALFERNTFKYGERGYRFTLLEAGHVAQNINLVATALGLGCMNIGGYFDRDVDTILGLDGLTHSTIYMIALGQSSDVPLDEVPSDSARAV